jgi:hypothetical protein
MIHRCAISAFKSTSTRCLKCQAAFIGRELEAFGISLVSDRYLWMYIFKCARLSRLIVRVDPLPPSYEWNLDFDTVVSSFQ